MSAAPTPRTRVRRAPSRGVYERAVELGGVVDRTQGPEHDGRAVVHRVVEGRPREDQAVEQGDGQARVGAGRERPHHAARRRPVEGDDARTAALQAFTEQLVPGRCPHVRPPNRKELKATAVLSLALGEASAKVRTGPPVDDDEDHALDVWAGVTPLSLVRGTPVPDPLLRPGIRVPDHL